MPGLTVLDLGCLLSILSSGGMRWVRQNVNQVSFLVGKCSVKSPHPVGDSQIIDTYRSSNIF